MRIARDVVLGLGLVLGAIVLSAVIIVLVLAMILHVDPLLVLFPAHTHPVETASPPGS